MTTRFCASIMAVALCAAIICLTPALLGAQTPAAPKAGDIPRLHDGKPDFSGIWDRPRVGDITRDSNECGSGSPNSKGCKQKGSGELSYTAWGTAQWKGERYDYAARCLPWGYTRAMQTAYPIEIVQTPKRLAILFESNNVFHTVAMDGRPLPKDPEPSWLGYSVGRYEGDTLVIETVGFNGKTWLDTGEHPSSEQLKVTERFRLLDANHVEQEVTWEDPKTYTKPIKNLRTWVRMKPGEEIMEWWCMENNKDLLEGHLADTHTLDQR